VKYDNIIDVALGTKPLKLKAWTMIVMQNEGKSLIDFAHPHHKTHVQQ
jgi:hypothetical protein